MISGGLKLAGVMVLVATSAVFAVDKTRWAAMPPIAGWKARMLVKPSIGYPGEARARGLVGFGVFVHSVDPKTGATTAVEVGWSTGHKILDDAAVQGLKKARFVPGSPGKVRTPVTFCLGARGIRSRYGSFDSCEEFSAFMLKKAMVGEMTASGSPRR